MTEAIRNAVKLGIISCFALALPFNSSADDTTPQAIDLGLSVKWGDRNLGASSPLEEGIYVAFGEVEVKEDYSCDSYLYCVDGNMDVQCDFGLEADEEEWYCLSGTQYDAAHVMLGGGWRMPTIYEIEELAEYCDWEFVDADSMPYLRISSRNGESIDFPLTGYMSLNRVIYQNQDLAVWSGSFYVEAGEYEGFDYYYNGCYFLGANAKIPLNPMEGNPSLGLQIRHHLRNFSQRHKSHLRSQCCCQSNRGHFRDPR